MNIIRRIKNLWRLSGGYGKDDFDYYKYPKNYRDEDLNMRTRKLVEDFRDLKKQAKIVDMKDPLDDIDLEN